MWVSIEVHGQGPEIRITLLFFLFASPRYENFFSRTITALISVVEALLS